MPRHAIAMHGEPALAEGFTVLPYARADAPKGGRLTIGALGTFDGLNPLVVKGVSAAQGINNQVLEPLMRRSPDEPFTLYGLIAQTIEMPEDRSWVVFRLNPAARFSDGTPITSADVKFTFDLLKAKGRPNHRLAFSRVVSVETPDAHTIRYDLGGSADRELPLILALMVVLPRHATLSEGFEDRGLTPLVGSGPYVIADVRPGRDVLYRRNPDYWGKDLPINRGLWNVDEVRYEYFRDANALFEAFKAGLVDYRIETDPSLWATAYDFAAVRDGRVVRESLPVRLPVGMSGFVFNTRQPIFQDIRVREALTWLFDFEWVNRNLFGGVYRRTGSYFASSDLSAQGQPASPWERAFLARFPGSVRPDILDGTWQPLAPDGSGRDRDLAERAIARLREAGWRLRDGVQVNGDGRPLAFEIMVVTRDHERLALSFSRSLARVGVRVRVRLVDSVQSERRRQRFDFDMLVTSFPASASPGNEQNFRWSSRTADREGSFNFAGVRSEAIDAAIEAMVAARRREEFVSAVRALDRLLLSGFYVVPLFHAPEQWVARYRAIQRPERVALFGLLPETMWRADSP